MSYEKDNIPKDTYNYIRLTKLYISIRTLQLLLVCLILFLHGFCIRVLISTFSVLRMSYMCTQFLQSLFSVCPTCAHSFYNHCSPYVLHVHTVSTNTVLHLSHLCNKFPVIHFPYTCTQFFSSFLIISCKF